MFLLFLLLINFVLTLKYSKNPMLRDGNTDTVYIQADKSCSNEVYYYVCDLPRDNWSTLKINIICSWRVSDITVSNEPYFMTISCSPKCSPPTISNYTICDISNNTKILIDTYRAVGYAAGFFPDDDLKSFMNIYSEERIVFSKRDLEDWGKVYLIDPNRFTPPSQSSNSSLFFSRNTMITLIVVLTIITFISICVCSYKFNKKIENKI